MEIIDNILNLIYPPVCGFCGKICKEHLCKKCKIRIKKHQINSLKKFNNRYFDEILYVFRYQDIIRDILINYKFNNKPYLYKTFLNIILKNEKIYGFLKKYDIIIPVPISNKRKKLRGYNQSYLIAREISKCMKLKLEEKCLIKQIDTVEQSKLGKEQRKLNVQGAYRIINPEKLSNKNVLLLDDIYTTGNTVKECAKVLKKTGVKSIGVLTIAKD